MRHAIPAFSDYAHGIRVLDSIASVHDDELSWLRLVDSERVRICYGPFEWINFKAKVVIVGITPGENTMKEALMTAGRCLRSGGSVDEAMECAKRKASFSNMRRAIGRMLDELGVHRSLGLSNSEQLFNGWHFLHATSCVMHPVFVRKKTAWEDYSGHGPDLLKRDIFVRYIEQVLATELNLFPDALIVPSGDGRNVRSRTPSGKAIDQ